MRVRYTGEDGVDIRHGDEMEVLGIIDDGPYQRINIIDRSGEDYLYSPDLFEVIEKEPIPKKIKYKEPTV